MVRSPGASCSAGTSKEGGEGGVINNKGPWTEAEDEILSRYVKAHGEGNWRLTPKLAGLSRCGKSCRLRWINYLRPNVKRGNFSVDEDNLILTLHALLGNRWSLIAGRIPGRTDNEIKNYWNTHLRRKLRSMGVDPMSYQVGLTLSTNSSDPSPNPCSNPCSEDPRSNPHSNPFSDPCSDPSSDPSSVPCSSSRAGDSEYHVPSEQLVSSPGDSASTCGTSFDTSDNIDIVEPSSCSSLMHNNVLSFHSHDDWGHPSCWEYSSSTSSSCDQFRLEHLQLLDDPLQYPALECNRSSSSGMLDSSSQHDQWTTTGLFDSLLD